MYKEIIEREEKKRRLLDKNNWKWDINSRNDPVYYIDSQGIEDAAVLIGERISGVPGVEITVENDHLDKCKRLVIIRFPILETRQNTLYRLVDKCITTSDLYIAWLTRTTATDTSKWDAFPKVPNSIECIISIGCLRADWKLKAVKSQKAKVYCFLREKMGVPYTGRLYLDYNEGNPHLIWHSCPVCDRPLSICERIFGNWWGRHIPDQWGC